MAARKKLPESPRPPAPRRERRGRYVLKLYVAGLNGRSSDAIKATTAFCDKRLTGGYHLEIIDIYQDPEPPRAGRITVVPALVRERPLPSRRVVGMPLDLDVILAGRDRTGRA